MDITSHRFIPDDWKRIALLLRKMRGDDSVNMATEATSQLLLHNLPTVTSLKVTGVPLAEAPGADLEDMDDRRFITISDFAAVELPDISAYHTIPRRETITFLMVYRQAAARGKPSWEFPPIKMSQDFINDILSKMYAEDFDHVSTYVRAGKWGRLSTVVLTSKSKESLCELPVQGICF